MQLKIIVFVTVKIAPRFASCNYMTNTCTITLQIHVTTYTNYGMYYYVHIPRKSDCFTTKWLFSLITLQVYCTVHCATGQLIINIIQNLRILWMHYLESIQPQNSTTNWSKCLTIMDPQNFILKICFPFKVLF